MPVSLAKFLSRRQPSCSGPNGNPMGCARFVIAGLALITMKCIANVTLPRVVAATDGLVVPVPTILKHVCTPTVEPLLPIQLRVNQFVCRKLARC